MAEPGSPDSGPEVSGQGPASGRALAGETGLVWVSLAAGHVLNLVSLSLVSASLGLQAFGNWGLCLVDFGVFANLANFALPVAAVPLVTRLGFTRTAFSLAAHARLWTTLLSLVCYLAFESAFRTDPEMLKASLILGLAIVLNPQQLEWWSVARRSFSDLLFHRLASGMVTLAVVLFWVRASPGLVSAAGAFAAGQAAGFLVLALRARSGFPLRVAPAHPDLRAQWATSLPVALTGVFDFLFLPLGFYAFRFAHGEGELLGAYGTAHRLALAASLAASSLFLVLLPRFSRQGPADLATSAQEAARLALRLDRGSLVCLALLIPVPFLTRPVLSLLFPGSDWTEASLGFASWALACMAASTVLHLLRMAPLTRALAEGKSWLYAGAFFLAGGTNVLAVGLAARFGEARFLPAVSLAADALFTAWWILHLHRRSGPGLARVAFLLAALGAYLAWAHRFA